MFDRSKYHNLLARLTVMAPSDIVYEHCRGVYFSYTVTETHWYQCIANNIYHLRIHKEPYIMNNSPEDVIKWVDMMVETHGAPLV